MSSSNAGQLEFWNSDPGQNWAACQPDLDVLLGGIRDLLLTACQPQKGDQVLDIGCGAGASTFAAADAVGPEGRVEGLDISTPLLKRADERRRELGLKNVTFTNGDAQHHAFEPRVCHMAVSRFGVMFFSDPTAAFRNIGSAIRTGGRFTFVAWAGPENNPWFTTPQRAAASRFGPMAPPPSDAPGPMAFCDEGRVLGFLVDAGFIDCSCSELEVDLYHPGGLDAVMKIISQVGPIGRMVREKNGNSEDHRVITEAIAHKFEEFCTSEGFRIPGRVKVYTAQVA